MFRRQRNRLPLDVYRGGITCFVTTSVFGGWPAFAREEAVTGCLSVLRACCEKRGVELYAYCFMPDHVHLLLLGIDRADVIAFVRDFKQRSGFACNRLFRRRGVFWQKSYYDHVLRGDEEIESVAKYIWGNPVRAGLVDEVRNYPFSGSLVFGDEVLGR
jgi:putative transposase